MIHGDLLRSYSIKIKKSVKDKSEKRFGYYSINKEAMTDHNFTADFIYHDNKNIRIHMLGASNTEICIGTAPAMRKDGDAEYLDIRRKGPENTFIVVHEPYNENTSIKKIKKLRTDDKDTIALEIIFLNGQKDIVISSLNNMNKSVRIDRKNKIFLSGKFGFIRSGKRSGGAVYLLDGKEIQCEGKGINVRSFYYEGKIVDIKRKEKGDQGNYFVTSRSILNNSETDLSKKILLLTLPDARTETYIIDKIINYSDYSHIYVKEDPGIEIRNGNLVKYVYYPWHGIRGKIHFRILNSSYQYFGR